MLVLGCLCWVVCGGFLLLDRDFMKPPVTVNESNNED